MLRITAPWVLLVFAFILGVGSHAYGEGFKEGKDYIALKTTVPVRDNSKVEVLELFWYGCPHCDKFDPFITGWKNKQPEYVDFWHSPAIFSNLWKVHAQAFYTAEVLGVGEQMHRPLFDALVRDKKPLTGEKSLAKFFASHGVNEDEFLKAYNSFSVKSKVQQAEKRTKNYSITGVPAVIVNGKYRVEPGGAGTFGRFLEIVDYLVAKEQKQLEG